MLVFSICQHNDDRHLTQDFLVLLLSYNFQYIYESKNPKKIQLAKLSYSSEVASRQFS